MIDRIDILPFEDRPGIIVTFHYDTSCLDSFAVLQEVQVAEIMDIVESGEEPGLLLVAIRKFGNFSLH